MLSIKGEKEKEQCQALPENLADYSMQQLGLGMC